MPDIFVDKEIEEHKATHPDDHAIRSVGELLQAKEKTIRPFTAYAMRPKGIKFVNQEPDEVVILFLRRHFITNLPWIISTAALLAAPFALFFLSLIPSLSLSTLPSGLIISVIAFYYLVVLTYAFSKFISWFYNIGIVTQKRIVDLDSTNILSHNSATAIFNEIVDVKFTQKGFFQSFFDYGDIHIQTEAIHANFEFIACPKPTQVSDIISDLRVATKGRHVGTI